MFLLKFIKEVIVGTDRIIQEDIYKAFSYIGNTIHRTHKKYSESRERKIKERRDMEYPDKIDKGIIAGIDQVIQEDLYRVFSKIETLYIKSKNFINKQHEKILLIKKLDQIDKERTFGTGILNRRVALGESLENLLPTLDPWKYVKPEEEKHHIFPNMGYACLA